MGVTYGSNRDGSNRGGSNIGGVTERGIANVRDKGGEEKEET